jgi:hypothetical protein
MANKIEKIAKSLSNDSTLLIAAIISILAVCSIIGVIIHERHVYQKLLEEKKKEDIAYQAMIEREHAAQQERMLAEERAAKAKSVAATAISEKNEVLDSVAYNSFTPALGMDVGEYVYPTGYHNITDLADYSGVFNPAAEFHPELGRLAHGMGYMPGHGYHNDQTPNVGQHGQHGQINQPRAVRGGGGSNGGAILHPPHTSGHHS